MVDQRCDSKVIYVKGVVAVVVFVFGITFSASDVFSTAAAILGLRIIGLFDSAIVVVVVTVVVVVIVVDELG